MRPALVTLLLSSSAWALEPCTLSGEGDVELCEKVYWRSRLATVAVPSYTVMTDGKTLRHGLQWTLAIDVPKDEWSEYFALGATDAKPSGFPFQLGVAASFVWYPGDSVEGRLLLRGRVLSLVWPESPALSFVHLTVGTGASGGTYGIAPRIELRARVGHIAWGGVVVAVGFQPAVRQNRYTGDLSVGLEAPWVWWW